MGSWNDILKEVNETQSQYDHVRRKCYYIVCNGNKKKNKAKRNGA